MTSNPLCHVRLLQFIYNRMYSLNMLNRQLQMSTLASFTRQAAISHFDLQQCKCPQATLLFRQFKFEGVIAIPNTTFSQESYFDLKSVIGLFAAH